MECWRRKSTILSPSSDEEIMSRMEPDSRSFAAEKEKESFFIKVIALNQRERSFLR